MDMRYRQLHPALFGLGMQRGAIFQLLAAAWTQERQLHCGREIALVDHRPGVLRDMQGDTHGPYDWSVPTSELGEAGRDAARWRADLTEVWPEALGNLRVCAGLAGGDPAGAPTVRWPVRSAAAGSAAVGAWCSAR